MRYNLSTPIGVEQFKTRCEYLIRKAAIVDLEEKQGKPRTNPQNKTFHMWVSVLADYFGYTSNEECKRDVKRTILGMKPSENRITGETCMIDYETHLMSTKELSEFLDKLKIWAQTEHGVYLPMFTDAGYDELINQYSKH